MGCGASSGNRVSAEVSDASQLPVSSAQLISEGQKKSLQAPPSINDTEVSEGHEINGRHSAGSTRDRAELDGQEQVHKSSNHGLDSRRRSHNSVMSESQDGSLQSYSFTLKPELILFDSDAIAPHDSLATCRRTHSILDDNSFIFTPLLKEHARFLTNFIAVLDRNSTSGRDKSTGVGRRQQESTVRQRANVHHEAIAKPKLEVRQFKSHTMDNVRVRKVCDELLHLEDPSHQLPAESLKDSKGWMRTLQISVGRHVHSIKMNNNPEVKIGGYFLISQMLSYIRGLVSLDISSNDLRAAEARVLSLGLKTNRSVQELRMRDNSIGSEGATSMADMLKVNNTLLLLDLRMNNIRGAGVCVLADAVSDNATITELDMRWNYAGECSNFVELALTDLKKFTHRNMFNSLDEMNKAPSRDVEAPEPRVSESSPRLSEAVTEKAAAAQRAESGPGLAMEPSMMGMGMGVGLGEEEAIGRLEVTVLSARNLPQVIWTAGKDGEFLGLPQAYCVFTLNKQTTQTAISKKDWSPQWMYTFSMTVREVWQVCSVKVMHSKSLHRTHRDDYTVGNVNLPVGAVINWRGVSHGADGTYRAFYRPTPAGPGTIYQSCKGRDKSGRETDLFDTEVEAARSYDDVALRLDGDRGSLNFWGDGAGAEKRCIGQHVKEESLALSGEDGVPVIGVAAGVPSTVRLRLKFFARRCRYVEVHLDRATALPKMDAGLGSCDAYCKVIVGDYRFRSRVVRNSLDPEFQQSFRVAVTDAAEELELRVELWDWDRIGDDDRMGDAALTFTPRQAEGGKLDGKYTMRPAGEGAGGTELVKNKSGELSHLHLRITFDSAHDDSTNQTSLATGGF